MRDIRLNERHLDRLGAWVWMMEAARMKGLSVRVMAVAALAVPLVWIQPAGAATAAGAATPQVFHTQVSVSLTGIDVCGFTVDSVIRGTDTFEVFFDRTGNVSTIQDVSHVVSTLTNEANGNVVYVENASRDNQPAPMVNPDGTITTTDTLTGMPVRIYTSHSNTLVKDVGYLSLVNTFDAQGVFLNQQVIVHGPHPGKFPFCHAITSAIG
jgi:hypothetical protein